MRSLVIALWLVGSAGFALAYHQPDSYAVNANIGGGGGSYFTGSPRFKAYNCNICHVAAEKRISIEINSPLTTGNYEGGLIYPIEIKLIGEHRGLASAFNGNAFTAEITDDLGNSIGTMAPGSDVASADEGRVAVGHGEARTQWEFSWWAPKDAVPARLYIAMLDGDGTSDPKERAVDPLSDDVATLRVDLCPSNAACEPPAEPVDESSPAGCSASRSTPGIFALIVLLLLAKRRRNATVAD